MDPSGTTRLSDLSEEDVKSVRSLLLMELTAQCDHLNIQIRRKKGQKPGKKTSLPDEGGNGIFGVPLETLLAKDRRITGENNSIEVPLVFEKVGALSAHSQFWAQSFSLDILTLNCKYKRSLNIQYQ
jgi:hypothetical protein